MADITSACTIEFTNQDVTRPFAWHIYRVTVPAAEMASTTVDDVTVERYPINTRLVDAFLQVIQVTDNGTSSTIDLEMLHYDTVAGTEADKLNVVTGLNGLILDHEGMARSGMLAGGFHDGVANEVPAINLEITPAGTNPTADLVMLVGVCIGRVEY